MKKLTLAFLVAALVLAPVRIGAQTGGRPDGTQAPAGGPSDKPQGPPSSEQHTAPPNTSGDPATSPPRTSDLLYLHNTKADCEKAGGKWLAEVSPTCTKP